MKPTFADSYKITALTIILGTLAAAPVKSQPITPANDGTNTTVTPQGNQFNIEGGTRSGANLFHSFDKFNVNSGQTANFLTTPDTSNILGRVTGGNASYVNGLIQVIGGNSNLFLMNPAGIMFGPNASLNIPASFSVTTATGIGFDSNNYWFKAMGTNDYGNLVGDPSGYRFNVSNPGAIVNEGNLSLNPGENLTLLGGTVINTGELSTAGGNVTIAAVEGGSVLRISKPGHLLSLEVGTLHTTSLQNGENISEFNPLSLPELLTGGEDTHASSVIVNANGEIVLTDSNTLVEVGDIHLANLTTNGGAISIQGGGNITTISIDSSSSDGDGGNVEIQAVGNISTAEIITDAGEFLNFAGYVEETGGSGNAGNIRIETTEGSIDTTAGLFLARSVSGNGGNVEITAAEKITTADITTYSHAQNSGNIIIESTAGAIDITEGLNTSSFDGNGGNIQIKAAGDITTSGITTQSNQNAGNITIESTAGTIDTTAKFNGEFGGFVRALSGDGNGGNIEIKAAGDITTAHITAKSNIQNAGNITIESTAGAITAQEDIDARGRNNGGNIEIKAAGDITTAHITTESDTQNAGNITIESRAGAIDTTAGFVIASSNDGDGGDLEMRAARNISTADITTDSGIFDFGSTTPSGFEILSKTHRGSGNAGNIIIESTAGYIDTTAGSVEARSVSGNGGNIAMTAGGDIKTRQVESFSSSVSERSSGNGGDITITAGGDIINTEWLDASFADISNSGVDLERENGGDAGNISLSAEGDIIAGWLYSFSWVREGNSGEGGNITLTANGNINTYSFDSFSFTQEGKSGNGGDITLRANNISFNTKTPFVENGDQEQRSPSFSDVNPRGFANPLNDSYTEEEEVGNITAPYPKVIEEQLLQLLQLDTLGIRTFSLGTLGTNESGNGGNVNITANNVSNTEIFTLSSHSESGELKIDSQPEGNLELNNLSIITSKQVNIQVPFQGEVTIDLLDTQGQSGPVSIISSGNVNLNNVSIESDTKGDQPAGNVNITSQGTITFDNSNILSITNAQGNAGEITLQTPQDIELTNNSTLEADTQGTGKAGNINIEAGTLNLNQNTSLTTETSAAGAPGQINIKANTIDIGENAQISATVTAESTNTEGGGNIDIFANTLNISGNLGIFAETAGLADAGSLIIKTYNDNPNLDINFSNDGFISASTSSTGNGGNINISAPETINIQGNGNISVQTTDIGNAGTINIDTQNLTLSDKVAITASTENKGNAGTININTNNLTLETGTSLTTETNSTGKAGEIEINTRQLTIGEDAQISATAREGATNTEAGGNITINATELFISGQLGIFAETAGESPAGTLTLNHYSRDGGMGRWGDGESRQQLGEFEPNLNITFTENGFISARTTSIGDGGNINIFAPENINIYGEGRITVETTSSGDAGIINIKTENLTIAENTTISAATSDSGEGGSINITPSQTFQLEGQILTETTGTGNGGTITINTGEMTAPNSTISAKSTEAGNAGEINIAAENNITTGIITSEASSQTQTADGGNISITSEQGEINATQPIQSFSDGANAGDVTLQAKTDITTNTISSHGQQQGGQITITSETGNIDTSNGDFLANYSGGGDAGNLTLTAPQGYITTTNIYSFADADGGKITIRAGGDINLKENSNIISASEPPEEQGNRGAGRGGDIILEAGNNINTTTAQIYSGADVGDTGKIEIIAEGAIETGPLDLASGFVRDRVTVNENFTLIPKPEGQATQGVAGNITLNSNNSTIDTTAGTINSRSPDGTGNISLNARENITTGKLEASALNESKPTTGGNVEIISQQGEINANQAIETFSQQGTAGNVNITAEGHIHTDSILSQGMEQGGNITINSRSENSIDATGALNTYSEEGIAGDVTLSSPGNINISSIRSEGMEQGGDIKVESEIGEINSTGNIDSYSEEGRGGNVEVNAPESVNLENVLSYGMTESGNLIIQSSQAQVETGNVETQAPAGSSGSIEINGTKVGTGNLRSIGKTSADAINVEATDGSINTYNIEIKSDGTIGSLTLQATENINTANIEQITGKRNAEVDISSGEDITIESINQLAEGDTLNVQTAEGDITIESIDQVAGNDAVNIQSADGSIIIGSINQIAEGNITNVQSADGKIIVGSVNQANSEQFSDQVITMLEKNRTKEYSNYFGTNFNPGFISTKNVREILNDMANQTGKESAVIYINAYPEQLQLILYTKSGQPIIKTIPEAKRKKLMKTALKLRAHITNPSRRFTDSYLPPAQQLYNWLIAPISAELEVANIDTLLFSMNEGLRTLPVAALHDGAEFLIEKYSLSLIPSVSLMDTNYRPLQDTQVLAMGASEFLKKEPLPAVPVELKTISQKLWQGSKFINENFTRNNLLTERKNYPYPIIHLATHAEFLPGQASNSYIQLWGADQIKLDQVRELGWSQPAVELLVLSACRTAIGDRNAELGYAGLAVAAGVKSALASVWYVSDEGTLGLMTEFYTHLNNAKIKAEALRQAQLAMLRGEVVITEGELRGSGTRGAVVLPSALANMENHNLYHPYYWAGFTMVGSPW